MRAAGRAALVVAAMVVFAVAVTDDEPTRGEPSSLERPSAAAPPAPPPAPAGDDLLLPAGNGDGDSWRDTAGREYRLGLVNAPETDECFGPEATDERKRLTAGGFGAEVYATDAYGRSVAVVTLADGTNLNVRLARTGFADDRYLEDFRSENPGLGAALDAAFAAARAEGVGLWGACRSADPAEAQPPPRVAAPAQAGCHPSYLTCVPVRGTARVQAPPTTSTAGRSASRYRCARSAPPPTGWTARATASVASRGSRPRPLRTPRPRAAAAWCVR